MINNLLRENIQSDYGSCIFIDYPAMDDAIIGVGVNNAQIIYSYNLMLTSLMTEEKMSLEEAVLYIKDKIIKFLEDNIDPKWRPIIVDVHR